MAIHLANIELDPPVLLAPMAGITDLPYRRLVASFGAGLVVSEMVASQEMVQAKRGVCERAELGLDDGNTAVQIAGRDSYWMSEAARMVEANGARVIDINMGCPAKRVVGGLSGSALLRDPDHALRLIDAVVGAVKVPVTLKTRLGWDDDSLNATAIALSAQSAGIRMLTLHGRTRCQFYKGRANWAAISRTARVLDIPVIANGDICDPGDARQAMVDSSAAGVMIGRGAQGRPWQPALIAAALFDRPWPRIPTGAAFVDMVRAHHTGMLSFYGRDLGMRVARKHLGWYMDVAQTPAPLRREVLTASAAGQVARLLASALDRVIAVAA